MERDEALRQQWQRGREYLDEGVRGAAELLKERPEPDIVLGTSAMLRRGYEEGELTVAHLCALLALAVVELARQRRDYGGG